MGNPLCQKWTVSGNYKDNRFNAQFQTAADVFLHHKAFVTILESVTAPNLKLQSVSADLKSEEIITIVQYPGLFHLNLTGPYWNLIIQNKISFLKLHKEVCNGLDCLVNINSTISTDQ
jgi:hypothetical protein